MVVPALITSASLPNTPSSRQGSYSLDRDLPKVHLPSNDTPFNHPAEEELGRGEEAHNTATPEIQKPEVAFEVYGVTFSEVAGFVEKMYPALDTSVEEHIIRESYDPNARKWRGWPQNTTKKNVAAWLEELQEEIRITPGCTSFLKFVENRSPGGQQECRKPDLVFLDHGMNSPEVPWTRIRAFGELEEDPEDIGMSQAPHSIVVSMVHRAGLIFRSQPGRRCVQAFTLGGDHLRCFLIDRAGVVASQAFSIHEKKELALRVFWAFFHGALDWYGLDPSIKGMLDRCESIFDPTSSLFDTVAPYIRIPGNTIGSSIRVFLDRQPFEARKSAISRGSTLWRAKDENGRRLVVKDQWRNAENDGEGEILMTLAGKPGISAYAYHEDILLPSGEVDRTNVIRAHLGVSNGVPALPSNSPPLASRNHRTTPSSSGRPCSQLSAEKGEEGEGEAEDLASNMPEYTGHLPTRGKRRLSLVNVKQTPKRRRVVDPHAVSPLHKGLRPYERIHSRLVMASDGRPLSTFRTATELFGAIRCALIGHQNALESGVLHRDISTNNILISHFDLGHTNPDPSKLGFLIDFDHAIKTSRLKPSGAPHRIGTPLFMAIGILSGENHDPCHDLHSFFYVLLYMLSCYDCPTAPAVEITAASRGLASNPLLPSPRMNAWGSGTYETMRQSKLSFFLAAELDGYVIDILSGPGWQERRDVVLPLIWSWVEVCFPRVRKKSLMPRNDVLERTWKLQHLNKEKMYEVMISSLDEAIKVLEGR